MMDLPIGFLDWEKREKSATVRLRRDAVYVLWRLAAWPPLSSGASLSSYDNGRWPGGREWTTSSSAVDRAPPYNITSVVDKMRKPPAHETIDLKGAADLARHLNICQNPKSRPPAGCERAAS